MVSVHQKVVVGLEAVAVHDLVGHVVVVIVHHKVVVGVEASVSLSSVASNFALLSALL